MSVTKIFSALKAEIHLQTRKLSLHPVAVVWYFSDVFPKRDIRNIFVCIRQVRCIFHKEILLTEDGAFCHIYFVRFWDSNNLFQNWSTGLLEMFMYESRKPDQVRNKMEINTSHKSRFFISLRNLIPRFLLWQGKAITTNYLWA